MRGKRATKPHGHGFAARSESRSRIRLVSLPPAHPADEPGFGHQVGNSKALPAVVRGLFGLLEKEPVEVPAADNEPLRDLVEATLLEVDHQLGVPGTGEDNAGDGGPGQLADTVQQVQLAQDGHRLAREGVAADLIAGEGSLVQQQAPQAVAPGVQGRRRPGGSAPRQ